jgi:hypothetical protein
LTDPIGHPQEMLPGLERRRSEPPSGIQQHSEERRPEQRLRDQGALHTTRINELEAQSTQQNQVDQQCTNRASHDRTALQRGPELGRLHVTPLR